MNVVDEINEQFKISLRDYRSITQLNGRVDTFRIETREWLICIEIDVMRSPAIRGSFLNHTTAETPLTLLQCQEIHRILFGIFDAA